MPGLTIAWEYLTGRCVATDPASRQRAEWPPHPGRVFMAMAAAWFETGKDKAEGDALSWLEKLSNPELGLPPRTSVFQRTVMNVFVPVNDVAGPSSALLQSAPITRSKQPRTFPSVWVGDGYCFLHWPNADTAEVQRHRAALEQLCGKVTRIGHSSSLVRMWVAEQLPSTELTETWVPDESLADLHTRCFSEGTLNLLDRQFNRQGSEQHQGLKEQISTLQAEKPKGKRAKEQTRFDPRDPIRPKLGLWTGYRRKEAEPPPSAPHANFDSDLLILTQVDGPRLPLASTLAVTRALRGAVMAHISSNIPDWISGHKANGEPARNGNHQLAFISLPFVGHEHADGHLLGVGLVFPRGVPRAERGRVLSRFLVSETGQPRDVELTLGRLGVWTVRKRDWLEHRRALQPETWTAHPRGATTWASVTPVVLDRFPKCDPVKERPEWEAEVAGIITTSCERLGLPAPVEMAVGTTSWHRGSLRAVVKRRPLRGHPELSSGEAALGDGFPPYPTKGGNGPRPQFHVRLRFAEPVVGPVLLGAGRFFGYGLCKPLWGGGAE